MSEQRERQFDVRVTDAQLQTFKYLVEKAMLTAPQAHRRLLSAARSQIQNAQPVEVSAPAAK
jgi:hypothetical protein